MGPGTGIARALGAAPNRRELGTKGGSRMADERGNGQQDWAEWLTWLNLSRDPLGIQRLLEQSTQALEQAATPQQAATRISEAMAAESERRREQGEGLVEALQSWAKTLASVAPLLPDQSGFDTPWAAAAPLGPYPRQQALWQALNRDSDAYQQALAQHLDSVTTLTERCTQAFRDALTSDAAGSAKIERPDSGDGNHFSPEQLMERWSAVAEPIYEDWLDQADTKTRLAALTNAWSALVNTLRALADGCFEALGLPSTRGMDDLAQELQRQRRHHRQAINELRAQIAELRQQTGQDKP